MSTVNRSTTPCPACLQSGVLNYVANQAGRFESFCVTPQGLAGPHKWQETEQLRAEIAAATLKYPAMYKGPEAPPPTDFAASANSEIIISPGTRKLLEELAKEPIRSESDVKAILFEAVQTRNDNEEKLKRLEVTVAQMRKNLTSKSTGAGGAVALSPNQVVVTIPEWAESLVEDLAGGFGKTSAEWVTDEFNAWIEQYCGSGQLTR